MKKNELLEDIINSSLCGQLDLMFGDGSYVKVGHLGYVESQKKFIVHVTLYISNIEDGMTFYPDGLETIVRLGWKVIGRKKPLMILPSVDVKV
jgi:hypothetical protein